MWEFLNSNWVWSVSIGAILWMHFGHGAGHGGHGDCGGPRQSGRGRERVGTQAAPDQTRCQHEHRDDRLERTWASIRGGHVLATSVCWSDRAR